MLNVAEAKPKASSRQKEVSLAQLYEKFTEGGYSSDSMPELNQRIAISGVVLGHTSSIVGRHSILSAGDEQAPDDELARLGARDAREDKKMNALAEGTRFSAVCVLDMTSGSAGGYMSFSDCVFK